MVLAYGAVARFQAPRMYVGLFIPIRLSSRSVLDAALDTDRAVRRPHHGIWLAERFSVQSDRVLQKRLVAF